MLSLHLQRRVLRTFGTAAAFTRPAAGEARARAAALAAARPAAEALPHPLEDFLIARGDRRGGDVRGVTAGRARDDDAVALLQLGERRRGQVAEHAALLSAAEAAAPTFAVAARPVARAVAPAGAFARAALTVLGRLVAALLGRLLHLLQGFGSDSPDGRVRAERDGEELARGGLDGQLAPRGVNRLDGAGEPRGRAGDDLLGGDAPAFPAAEHAYLVAGADVREGAGHGVRLARRAGRVAQEAYARAVGRDRHLLRLTARSPFRARRAFARSPFAY